MKLIQLISLFPLFLLPGVGQDNAPFFLTVGGINVEEGGKRLEALYGNIHVSDDGIEWWEVYRGGLVTNPAAISHANNNLLRCAAHGVVEGRDTFVVSGNHKAILVSHDPRDSAGWLEVPVEHGGMNVAFGNGWFLCLSAGHFARSRDGREWESGEPTAPAGDAFTIWGENGAGHVRKLVFGKGVFVAVGEQRIGVTEDGSRWLHHRIIPKEKRFGRFTILFGNETFVLFTEKQGIATSRDGIKWTRVEAAQVPGDLRTIALNALFEGSQFLTTGSTWKDRSKRIHRSVDGRKWTAFEAEGEFVGLHAGGGKTLLHASGCCASLSTNGGNSWTKRPLNFTQRRVFYFDGNVLRGPGGG